MSFRASILVLLATVACELPTKNLGEPNSGGDASTGEATSGGTDDTSTGTGGTTGGPGESSTGSSSGGDVMCNGDPLMFPEFARQCAVAEDCAVVLHQVDCCGSMVALGIDQSEVPAFDAAEATCAMQYPGCGCAPMPTVNENGEVAEPPAEFKADCVDGVCMAVVDDPCAGMDLPACPPECDPNDFPTLCGQPCDMEGAACGNNIGDGMQCMGGTWLCSVHPPLGPGCNLVCK